MPSLSKAAEGGAQTGTHVVLLADRSPEAEGVANALRDDGFTVISSDVVALPERVNRLRPFAVVVDVEQPHAATAISRMRAGSSLDPNETTIIPIGVPERIEEQGIVLGETDRVFSRPVAALELVSYLREVATFGCAMADRGPSSVGSSSSTITAAGPSSTGYAEGSSPERDSEASLADFPAIAGLPEVESFLPELEGPGGTSSSAARLSPEIEALLTASVQRVADAEREEHDIASPAASVPVPPDLMAQIDELLAPDEELPPATRDGRSVLSASGFGQEARSGSDRVSQHASSAAPTTSADIAAPRPLSTVPPRSDAASDDEQRGAAADESSSAFDSVAPMTVPHDPTSPGMASRQLAARGLDQPGSAPPRLGLDRGPSSEQEQPASATGHPEGKKTDWAPRSGPQHALSSRQPTIIQPHPASPEASERSTTPEDSADAKRAPDSTNLQQGHPAELLARAICHRSTGALVFVSDNEPAQRRVLMRDGDLVTAASERTGETLVHFLIERGDLGPEVANLSAARLPQSGRHAAAALIANGFLNQDDLWPVLRSHAEWTIARALREEQAMCKLERHPAERLLAEPNVFGGAAGVEVFVELVRRVVSVDQAVALLGGPDAVIGQSAHAYLLAESALAIEELDRVGAAIGEKVGRLLATHGPELSALLYALVCLQILSSEAPPHRLDSSSDDEVSFDPLDADAVRKRVAARMGLVREADYFSLLGVPRRATSYEVRHAFVRLRRSFEPNRVLTAATVDLREDLNLIIEVLEEAYEVLRDQNRRNRYRKAIEAAAEGP